jgi:hypothetical protein
MNSANITVPPNNAFERTGQAFAQARFRRVGIYRCPRALRRCMRPLNAGVRRRSVPLRIAGVLAFVLGIGIVALAASDLNAFDSVVALASTNGDNLFQPLSQDDVQARSRVLFGVTALCGFLTITAGLGFFLGRRWGLYVAAIATLVLPVFPLLTRLLPGERFHFQGPDIFEFFISSLIGLVASLAYMFQSRSARAA